MFIRFDRIHERDRQTDGRQYDVDYGQQLPGGFQPTCSRERYRRRLKFLFLSRVTQSVFFIAHC